MSEFGQTMLNVLNDGLDLLGIGSARREREWQEEQAQKQMQFQTNSAMTQMDYNAEQAKINREFQEMQRKTQYQTAVADMKAAGLNPVMALGSPASPTSGATASTSVQSGAKGNGSSAGVGILLNAISSVMNSASKIAKYS